VKRCCEGARVKSRRPHRGGRVVLVAGLVLASCGGQETRRPAAPAPPPVIPVEMREFSFGFDGEMAAGRTVFRLVNRGSVIHQPLLLRLDDDLPPLAEQLAGDQRRPVDPFAGTLPRRPGQVGTFAVDLIQGQRYGLICVATDEQGISHARRGMNAEFRPEKGEQTK
jgi:hypothetical protein